MEKKESIRELAEKILELTKYEHGWFKNEYLTDEDMDGIYKLGEDDNYVGLQTKLLWFILKYVKEIRDKLDETHTHQPVQIPAEPWPIGPYSPYVPAPTVPNPWQVWCQYNPSVPVNWSVTCTYADTEGHDAETDDTQQFTTTCTYQNTGKN